MTFPNKNFPQWWDVHNSRASHISRHRGNLNGANKDTIYGVGRSLVADWSRMGGIDIDSNSHELTVLPQIDNTALCDWKLIGDSYPLQNSINPIKDIKTTLFGASKVAQKWNQLSSFEQQQRAMYNQCDPALLHKVQQVLTQEEVDDKKLFRRVSRLPPSIYNMVEHSPDVITEKFANKALSMVDAKYSNNLALTDRAELSDNELELFYLTGSDMRTVSSTVLDLKAKQIRPNSHNKPFNLPNKFYSTILGINLCCNNQRLLIRKKHSVDIFTRNSTSQPVSLTFADKIYSSVPNTFIPEQTLVTFKDSLLLFADNQPVVNFYVQPNANTPKSMDIWSWAEFANHPTEFYYTDRSQCILWDARCYNSGVANPSQFLFDLNQAPVNSKEHLYHFKQLATNRYDSLYFLVCTNFNSFIMDRRMPLHPILQWTTPLLHPCTLSHSMWKDGTEHLFQGSQHHGGLAYSQFSLLHGEQPVRMYGPSLTFSNISLGISEALPEIDAFEKSSVDRLTNCSMIGVGGTLLGEKRCLSLRLTSWGDLFAQEAQFDPSEKELSYQNKFTKERFVSWLSLSVHQSTIEQHNTTGESNQEEEDMFSSELPISRILANIDLTPKKHPCCGFCQPEAEICTWSVMEDVCFSCGSAIKLWAYNSPELLTDQNRTEDLKHLLPYSLRHNCDSAVVQRIDHIWNHDWESLTDKKMIKKLIQESDTKDELFVSHCRYQMSKSFKLFNLRRRLFDPNYYLEWENMKSSYYRALTDDKSSADPAAPDEEDTQIDLDLHSQSELWPKQVNYKVPVDAIPSCSGIQSPFCDNTRPTFTFNSTVRSQPVMSSKRPLPSGFGADTSIQQLSKTMRLDSFFSQSQSQLF